MSGAVQAMGCWLVEMRNNYKHRLHFTGTLMLQHVFDLCTRDPTIEGIYLCVLDDKRKLISHCADMCKYQMRTRWPFTSITASG